MEGIRYLKTQPLEQRKKGFGTKDANKTDEFSNSNRTQQYREGIKKEQYVIMQAAGKIADRLKELTEERDRRASTAPAQGGFDYASRVPQYDIGRSRVTEFDPKSVKDTYYKFSDEHGKRYGNFR